jgi:hypothetical protein
LLLIPLAMSLGPSGIPLGCRQQVAGGRGEHDLGLETEIPGRGVVRFRMKEFVGPDFRVFGLALAEFEQQIMRPGGFCQKHGIEHRVLRNKPRQRAQDAFHF